MGKARHGPWLDDETRSGVGKSETWMHRIGRIKAENHKNDSSRKVRQSRTLAAEIAETRIGAQETD